MAPRTERSITGKHSQTLTDIKAGLKVDLDQLKKLHSEFDVLKGKVKGVREEMDKLFDSANKAAGAVGSATQGAGGGGFGSFSKMPKAPPAPTSPVVGQHGASIPTPTAGSASTAVAGAGAGGGGVLGKQGGYLEGFGISGVLAAGAAGIASLGAITRSVDSRIDRGAEFALPRDRQNVLLQLQTGQSQMEVMQNTLRPLADHRLGAGGDMALRQFASDTNTMSTLGWAGSISGMRALGGYGKTTADVLADHQTMLAPQTANRMFNTLGISPYNVGGGMRDPMQVQMDIVKRMGLADADILKEGMLEGSVTRMRMADAGIGHGQQTDILRLAQTMVSNPGKDIANLITTKEGRKELGIEDNFATQVEETDRVRFAREESFMERQVDNFASMERTTQRQVEILENIEGMLGDFIGARASSRGWQKWAGRALQVGGLGVAGAAGWTGIGALAGVGMVGVGTALTGDATGVEDEGHLPGGTRTPTVGGSSNSTNDSNIMVPYGYNGNSPGGKISLNELKTKSTFRGLSAPMQDRLLRMMRENPNIGIGQGLRDSGSQERMFRERYRPTTRKTKTFWEGTYWEHVSGAAAAPPGRSMHEIGEAADLVGDIAWMNANAARFGLRHFAEVNNEPWHVQRSELPGSRRQYEANGGPSAYGSYEDSESPVTGVEPSGESGEVGEHAPSWSGVSSTGVYAGMSISEIIEAAQMGVMSLSSSPWSFGSGRKGKGSSSTANVPPVGTVPVTGSGAELAARAAYNAGFRGEDLYKIVAIAGRESGFKPGAINEQSRDTGMWQIAPINWGEFSQQDLLDPMKNAQAAFRLFQSNGFHGWKAASSRKKNARDQWVVDPSGKGKAGWAMDGNEMWNTDSHQSAARAAVDAITGDPMPPDRGGMSAPAPMQRSSGNLSMSSPVYNFSVAPTFNIQTSGSISDAELKDIARKLGLMAEQELRVVAMRSD